METTIKTSLKKENQLVVDYCPLNNIDLLRVIFSFLISIGDLFNASLTCKLWNTIVVCVCFDNESNSFCFRENRSFGNTSIIQRLLMNGLLLVTSTHT